MSNETFQLYRCTECGKVSVSLGYLHGHIEKHVGIGPFNILPRPTKTANPNHLNQMTEVIDVTDYDRKPAEDSTITNGGEPNTEIFNR